MKHTPALIVLACFLALAIAFTGRFAAQVTGDVNGDGSVNALDVQLTINGALGIDIGGRDADINDDGSVNALDVQLCINAALGITNGGNGGGELPPDPKDVASDIDPTIPTAFADATEFIYAGDDPIQTDVAPETIEAKRVAVLRGKVTTRDGEPLPGVEVTILGHPEFGRTLTREDGMFDIAVNGGGLLTVNYAEEEHLSAQRQIDVPWRDYAWLPDVVMIPVDPVVTEIDLTASDPIQVAQGSVMTDDDGTRQATLLFPQGTSAELVMPDGSTQPLTTLNVRATEYTVGDTGPDAMPAILPPTSRYTYCVEVTADEAIDAGATDVAFDQPVYFHVENFIGFPVGSAVPVGYYDRQTAQWIASKNGLVIKIMSIDGGLAQLDTDGDDVADDVPALDALNITEAEREELAALYDPGQTLWRAPITHFTPWDCNWPGGPPGGAGGAGGSGGGRRRRGEGEDDPCADSGRCVIEFQGQVLGEQVPLAGVPYTLNYRSDRCPGRRVAYEMEIILSGDTIPGPLKRIKLEVLVAGHRFREAFPAETNQTHLFTWDGYDAYGRLLQGIQPLTIRIGYVYDAVYYSTSEFDEAFGEFTESGIVFEGDRAREEITLWEEWEDSIGVWDSRAQGMGGWTLDVHHGYSPAGRTLYMGDGSRRGTESLGSVVTTVAGGGTVYQEEDFAAGIPATEAQIMPYHVVAAPDGSVYFATLSFIFHIDSEGILTLVAGQSWPSGFEGDGGPAIDAVFDGIQGIDLGPDGSLYVADIRNNRIRCIGPDGIINTVAGNGTPGYAGDGGPATEAEIYSPNGVAVAPDGGFYISQWIYPRIRHVSPEGIITTVAGGDLPWGTIIEGGLATENSVSPTDVALGPDGSIYILDDNRIRRVTPDGIINTVVGTGTPGFSGDGGAATEARFDTGGGVGLAIGPDGTIYLPDERNNRIRQIGPDGIINTIAGNGDTAHSDICEGCLATGTEVNDPRGVSLGPDGTLYVACYRRIRTVAPASPSTSAGDLLVPSPKGGEVFVFDSNGRHLRTTDSLTGAVEYEFAYDSERFLASITDGDGNATTFERDDDGKLTAIVGPYGHRNEIVLDDEDYLGSVTEPGGACWTVAHSTDGLLGSFTDPNGATQTFTYGDDGRLIRDDDPAGGSIELDRVETETGFEVLTLSAEGRTRMFRIETLSGGTVRRISSTCDGPESSMDVRPDGIREVVANDGTTSTLQLGPDPRFGMTAPLVQSYTEATPGGLIQSYSQTRTATYVEDAVDLLHPLSVETMHILNGQVLTTRFSAEDLTVTRTTPEGRQVVTVLDERGRPIEYWFGTLAPIYPAYDARGRLWQITQGAGDQARTVTVTYNDQGFVESVTDPMGRAHSYVLDEVGRITRATSPGGTETHMSYDDRGNLMSLTPPDRPAHSFAYNAVNRILEHDPPDVTGSTDPLSMTYNLDHQVVSIARADGRTVDLTYADCGRIETTTIDRGVIQYEYDAVSGNLYLVTTPDGEISFGYDGRLITNMTWTGAVTGQVDQTYDEYFRVASRSINSADTLVFSYDNDGLLIQAGDIAITPDVDNGLITSTTLGEIADTWVYDEFGDVAGYTYSFGAEERLRVTYTRDKLGRITQKDETQGTTTDTYLYTYDLSGRLSDVARNGTEVAAYTYDPNGNRLTYTGSVSATYDDQDRLLSYGTITYTYRGDGSLSSRTDGSETTLYEYDELGSLVSVTLPDGTEIEYLIDGRNRRIGKRVDGSLVQGFLYKDMLNPVAELDGSGTVVSRFVYGTRPHVPDYMTRDGSTYRIVSDNVGSPRFVVNVTTGTVVQSISYNALGRVVEDTNPGFQPFGFAGGLTDPDTGLVRFGVRDYDPEVGRWTAPDPMLFGAGSTNLYAYVNNDPVNRADPSGLDDRDCDKPQDDCNGRTRERHISEGRRLSWRRSRFETSLPSWLDSVVGLGGAVSGTVTYMTGAGAQALAGASAALGLISWPIAFESARQTADDLAETLVDERVERGNEQLDEVLGEINRTTRERDCP